MSDKNREVKIWDFLNPNTPYASEPLADKRYDMCLKCPELIKITKQCKQCGCVMPLKTKLKEARCPLGKW